MQHCNFVSSGPIPRQLYHVILVCWVFSPALVSLPNFFVHRLLYVRTSFHVDLSLSCSAMPYAVELRHVPPALPCLMPAALSRLKAPTCPAPAAPRRACFSTKEKYSCCPLTMNTLVGTMFVCLVTLAVVLHAFICSRRCFSWLVVDLFFISIVRNLRAAVISTHAFICSRRCFSWLVFHFYCA